MNNERIHNFDFLRGFVVFLALMQHFGAYLNGWYVWHYDALGTASITTFHEAYANTRLPTDHFGVLLAWFFSPWVSHIYLALAGFNLAKRSRVEFASVFKVKLVAFMSLFIFFFVENAIVADSIGQMFSFYPLMAWMVILALLAVLYRYGGVTSILILYFLGLFQSVIGVDVIFDKLEVLLQKNFHSAFEYDARIHYYFSSGSLGFLLGYLYFQKSYFESLQNTLMMLLVGVLFYLLWFFWGNPFLVDASELLRYEHIFDRSFTGTCFNQGVQIGIITLFLHAHCRGWSIPQNPFHWIGYHSLLIFGFHRIFFLNLIGPTRELLGGLLGFPMTAYAFEVSCHCVISVGLSYLLLRSSLFNLIFRQGTVTKDIEK